MLSIVKLTSASPPKQTFGWSAGGSFDNGHPRMTKDGRPSLINDIRLFAGNPDSYLKGNEEAVAYGRRMAWFLNGEGVSLGAFPALYIAFLAGPQPGRVKIRSEPALWWYRDVHVEVTDDFPDVPDVEQIVMKGIVDALIALRPDCADTILRADQIVRDNRDGLRFLLKRRETKTGVIEISFNIGVWPTPSNLFISQIDNKTNTYRDAEPIALGWYDEGFDLVRGIRLKDAVNLTEAHHRPAMSGLVKRRG